MKIIQTILLTVFIVTTVTAQPIDDKLKTGPMNDYEILKTESRIPGLKIAITHKRLAASSNTFPVLFVHGASFPSGLAFAFRMKDYSWMDHLSENGYDVYALDFLGYGNADRYPEMLANSPTGKPLGRAVDVYQDIDKAVDLILTTTGKKKVYLIAHSWGGAVSSLYATHFPDKIEKLVLFAAITPRQETTPGEVSNKSYNELTPEQRIKAMKDLTPDGKICQLEPEILSTWGDTWLHSDELAPKLKSDKVRFPAGYASDIDDLIHGKLVYDPAHIRVPVLLIRGEWDDYPNNADAERLFTLMTNSLNKKYVVIESGTHVMHLEKNRFQLYNETLRFLWQGTNRRETNKHEIGVLFEVIPAEGKMDEYLNIAASLRPELEKIEGFISIERFQSIYDPGKILSLSFWESEEAIQQWRNMEAHRAAQTKGRSSIFKDYHLRIVQVIRDYGMFYREEAPADSRSYHADEVQ
jgi:pimeloyl-ACP methyl ester carboxylesterase/heme-degrading monooxygenase HmoA